MSRHGRQRLITLQLSDNISNYYYQSFLFASLKENATLVTCYYLNNGIDVFTIGFVPQCIQYLVPNLRHGWLIGN